jgi:hypothetical protein
VRARFSPSLKSQMLGVTSANLTRTEGRGLCLTILKDFAHLLLAALVADRSIPDLVLHKLWDGV